MKEHEKYTRKEMSNIAKNKGFVFVETSLGDNYIIKKDDICDFIMQESERQGHSVNMKMYVPNPDIEKPFLSTVGCFLDKINNNYRKEIIEKLIKLQTGQIKPEKVKVFDNDIFSKMSLEEFGEKQGEAIQFDKFFKKYYEQEEELEAE